MNTSVTGNEIKTWLHRTTRDTVDSHTTIQTTARCDAGYVVTLVTLCRSLPTQVLDARTSPVTNAGVMYEAAHKITVTVYLQLGINNFSFSGEHRRTLCTTGDCKPNAVRMTRIPRLNMQRTTVWAIYKPDDPRGNRWTVEIYSNGLHLSCLVAFTCTLFRCSAGILYFKCKDFYLVAFEPWCCEPLNVYDL